MAAFAAAAVALMVFAAPGAAQDEPPDPDDVIRRELLVVDGAGERLDSGGGTTPFSVELEGEDECPGDSQTDQFRIDSYLVPIDVDPSTLRYAAQGPLPGAFRTYEGFHMPLHKLSTDPYAAELTLRALQPGGPGPIPEIPDLSFAVYVPTLGIDDWAGGVPSGEYRLGVACTFAARITNLWETTIQIEQDPADEPIGITWTVTGPQPADLETAGGAEDDGGSNGPVYVLLAFGGVMAAAAAVLFAWARRSRPAEETAA